MNAACQLLFKLYSSNLFFAPLKDRRCFVSFQLADFHKWDRTLAKRAEESEFLLIKGSNHK